MGHRVWTTGDEVTLSRIQDLEDEGVSRVTSATRPPAAEGMLCYETDTDRISGYSGAAWVDLAALTSTGVRTWAPVVTQNGGSVNHTANEARYVRQGTLVTFWCKLTMTGNATGTGGITVSLPVTASGHQTNTPIGAGTVLDGVSSWYGGTTYLASTTTFGIIQPGANAIGFSPSFTLAVGDIVHATGTYTV